MTPKQERFVQEYLIDLNATQAAIRAGYSPHSANEIACEVLAKPNIRAHVDELMAERAKRTGVNADRIVRELARIAFLQPNQVINMDNATLIEGASEDDIAAIASVKVKTIPTSDGIGYEREIKVADKIKALELLGKHNGMFIDKHEITGKDGNPVEIRTPKVDLSALSDEELETYAALSAKARGEPASIA